MDNSKNQQNDNILNRELFKQHLKEKQDLEDQSKFDYLKAKYIFRFPHTITAIKWGLTLGTIFGLHTFIKTRNVKNTAYWFAWGTVMTGLPIWGFFMFKYSFYTMTLRKFEVDSYQQVEDSNTIKEFMIQRSGIKNTSKYNDEQLIKKVEAKQKQYYKKNSQLDSLLEDVDENEFELLPQQENQQNQEN